MIVLVFLSCLDQYSQLLSVQTFQCSQMPTQSCPARTRHSIPSLVHHQAVLTSEAGLYSVCSNKSFANHPGLTTKQTIQVKSSLIPVTYPVTHTILSDVHIHPGVVSLNPVHGGPQAPWRYGIPGSFKP